MEKEKTAKCLNLGSRTDHNKDFLLKSYAYFFGQERVALRPLEDPLSCRLAVYDCEKELLTHSTFSSLHEFLPKNSHLLLNNSRVIPGQVQGHFKTGGQCQVTFLCPWQKTHPIYDLFIKANRKKKIGDGINLPEGVSLEILEKDEESGVFKASFLGIETNEDLLAFLVKHANLQLPPYIRGGKADEKDKKDYQTSYASKNNVDLGSVAAPTAGLHFTQEYLDFLKSEKGIGRSLMTLHVGAGTFLPVRSEDIREHKMHEELYYSDKENYQSLKDSQDKDQNIIAVGTTSLRILESMPEDFTWDKSYFTKLFLHPGGQDKIKNAKGIITNFHRPESSLMMLVASIVGLEKTHEIYQECLEKKYRFFSYGDAMLILL